MKRVLIALTVADDVDAHDLATELECAHVGTDPTVWGWFDFWNDVSDGVISPTTDTTVRL